MAHNLEIRKGRASIAFTGETPWHKLGHPIKEAFDAETALNVSGPAEEQDDIPTLEQITAP